MAEIKPVPIWPGGKATAGQPTTPATSPSKPAAPAPSTKGGGTFGIPHAAPLDRGSLTAPTPAKPSSAAATPTGHPRDQWGQPWPGSKAEPAAAPTPAFERVATHVGEPPWGLVFELGDRFVRGADVFVLTPGGWRLDDVDQFLDALDELTIARRALNPSKPNPSE